jgi:hypothetical protein
VGIFIGFRLDFAGIGGFPGRAVGNRFLLLILMLTE